MSWLGDFHGYSCLCGIGAVCQSYQSLNCYKNNAAIGNVQVVLKNWGRI